MESARKFLSFVRIGNTRSTMFAKMYQVSVKDIISQVEFVLLVLMTTNFKMMEHVSLSSSTAQTISIKSTRIV